MSKQEWLSEGEGFTDVTLSRPLEIAGAPVTSLRMREPTVADQMASDAVKGGDAAKELSQFANLLELTPDDLQRLPLKDYARLQAAYRNFIG